MKEQKWNLILMEDDCAPDAHQKFEDDFLRIIGEEFTQWTKKAKVMEDKPNFNNGEYWLEHNGVIAFTMAWANYWTILKQEE